jgi:hypothetical protein
MSLPRFNEDVENISALGDRPNDSNGLTAAELKARFDKAVVDLKTWLNNTFIPALEANTAAGNIGIDDITGVEASNIQAALSVLKSQLEDVREAATGGTSSPSVYVNGGTFRYREVVQSGITNWEIALLSGTNAKLTFARTTGNIDVFMIGSGGSGGIGNVQGKNFIAGDGAMGGGIVEILNQNVDPNKEYVFTVGRGGSATTMFGQTTAGVQGRFGGAGASISFETTPANVIDAERGTDGVYPFGENTSLLFPGRKFGAGGGGGGAHGVYAEYDSRTHQTISHEEYANAADGGETGGGAGSNSASEDGGKALDNTGAGGGGCFASPNSSAIADNTGGSGIIIIRNARG